MDDERSTPVLCVVSGGMARHPKTREIADAARAHAAGNSLSGNLDEVLRHSLACRECGPILLFLSTAAKWGPPGDRIPNQQRRPAGDNVIALFPQQIVIRRLSPGAVSGPMLAGLESLHRRQWLDQGLPEGPALPERLESELVFVATLGDAPDARLVAALFGQLSSKRRPTFDELADPRSWGDSAPRSLAFFEVIVDDGFREQRLALRLFQTAVALMLPLYGPDVAVRSVSPIPGLRLMLARLVGAEIEIPKDAGRKKVWEHLQSLDVSAMRSELFGLRGMRAVAQAAHCDLETWLRRVACDPSHLVESQGWAEAPRKSLGRFLVRLARCYAETLWLWVPERERLSLLCYVAHMHRKQGGRTDGYLPFARMSDRDSLFVSMSFQYMANPERVAEERIFERRIRHARWRGLPGIRDAERKEVVLPIDLGA